jgi:hypothetical protein
MCCFRPTLRHIALPFVQTDDSTGAELELLQKHGIGIGASLSFFSFRSLSVGALRLAILSSSILAESQISMGNPSQLVHFEFFLKDILNTSNDNCKF